MKSALTKRQTEAYTFIRKYIKAHSMAPTFQEIADGLSMSSKADAYAIVNRLEIRGYITRAVGQARSMAITPDDKDEVDRLKIIRDAAATFVSVQETLRENFNADQASESTTRSSERVGAAFNNLRDILRD